MQPSFSGVNQQAQPASLLGNIMSAPSSLNEMSASTTPTFPVTPVMPSNSAMPFQWTLPSHRLLNGSSQQQPLLNQNSQQVQMPAISRQNDALSLDTIAVALHELEQLSWSKRSLSVNAADLDQVRMSPGFGNFGASAPGATPIRYPFVDKRPPQAALAQRRSCEPPFSPSFASLRPPPAPATDMHYTGGAIMTSSPLVPSSSFGFQQSPPISFNAPANQQRRSALSSSVPGSLDSYQIETETVDSGLGNDSSFFLLPTVLSAAPATNNQKSSGLPSAASSSQLMRHSAYQSHGNHNSRVFSSRRPRASSTAAAGPSSRRHLFYCRHHLQARQKPYHFPASCVSAIRNDNTLFNVSNGLPGTVNSNASQATQSRMYFRHSCSISSQSRSITPGSSPTRSSEADLLIPVAGSLMRSRSLDDVHRSVAASSVNSLSSRPGHTCSANQSDLGQWDHGEPEDEQDDELTIMSGIVGWSASGVQPPAPPPQQTQFHSRDWPHSGSMLQ